MKISLTALSSKLNISVNQIYVFVGRTNPDSFQISLIEDAPNDSIILSHIIYYSHVSGCIMWVLIQMVPFPKLILATFMLVSFFS